MNIKTVLTAVVLTFVGCGEAAHPTAAEPKGEEEATGTLSLKLTSADSDGRAYRLRNAVFNVYGYAFDIPAPISDAGGEGYSATISSEDDLDAPIISLKLVPGFYDVVLTNPDWYLERRVEGVWERVEQVVLLTGTYQSAYVYDQGVSTVNYRFGVDGELIDFRAGDLQIGISIEQPGEGAPDAGFFGGIGGLGGLLGGGTFGGGTFGGGTISGGTFGGGAIDAGVPVP